MKPIKTITKTVKVAPQNQTANTKKSKNINAKSRKNKTQRRGIKSPYLLSLMDPFNYRFGRIPDDVTTPSFLVNVDTRVSLNVGTNPSGTLGAFALFALQVGSVCCAANDYFTSIADTTGAFTLVGNTIANSAAIANTAGQIRPVSAGLALTFQGSTSSDQGEIACGFIPAGYITVGPTGSWGTNMPTNPTNMIIGSPYCATMPAAKRFCSVRYSPTDAIARSYSQPSVTPSRTQVNSSGAKYSQQYGTIWVMATGLTQSTVVEVRYVETFEVIPLQSTSSFQSTSPSYTNPMELAEVANLIASDRSFNVDQEWQNTMAGVSTNVMAPKTSSPDGQAHSVIPGVTSNSFLGDVGGKLGRMGGDLLEGAIKGMLL